jgi:hypothetical protein
MKSVLKKGKPVIEMHAPDRRALESARAVCDFIVRNAPDGLVKETAAENFVGLQAILNAFPAEEKKAPAAADAKDEKKTAAA